MDDDSERLSQYVEDLLQNHRPERTPLGAEAELSARQAAAMLRGASPGAGLPSSEFRQQMERLIQTRLREQVQTLPAAAGFTRRTLILTGLGSLAAGLLAALGVERLIRRPAPPAHDSPLVAPDRGQWVTVVGLEQLTEGKPFRFTAGSIEGYLVREGDKVTGMSAACTHMACLLNWSAFRDQFECPCHGATFEKSGQPSGKYASRLKRLPRLEVRVDEGKVEVFSV